jgi:cellulose synthase operon protein C
MLVLGKHDEALRLLDEVLTQRPGHPQALWNRGLVLHELGLELGAAKAFEAVAGLNEPGWSDEARENAASFRGPVLKAKRQWSALRETVPELIISGKPPPSSEPDHGILAVLRADFYDAVRASPTPERVNGLLSLGRAIDRASRGTVLEGYVNSTSSRSFARRRRLTEKYLELYQGRLAQPEKEHLLQELRKSGEDDLRLGALLILGVTQENLSELEQLVAATRDPWLEISALLERARVSRERNDAEGARDVLDKALTLAKGHQLEDQFGRVQLALAELTLALGRTDEAWSHAQEGLRAARRSSHWDLENQFLELIGRIARVKNDPSTSRAYHEEMLER